MRKERKREEKRKRGKEEGRGREKEGREGFGKAFLVITNRAQPVCRR